MVNKYNDFQHKMNCDSSIYKIDTGFVLQRLRLYSKIWAFTNQLRTCLCYQGRIARSFGARVQT